MGKPSSTTTSQQSGPPPQVLANYENVYNQAQGLASQPYPTYSGSLLAGFQPQQMAGFNDVNSAVNSYQPFLNQASQYANNATGLMAPGSFGANQSAYLDPGLNSYIGAAGNYKNAGIAQSEAASGSLNAQNFGNTVGSYYSPYAKAVIAPTEAQFNQQNAVQQQQLSGGAAAEGAYGGDREAVAASTLAGQQQLAEAPVIAGLETQGYNQAEQEAMQAAGLQQQTAGMSMQGAGQTLAEGNLQQSGFNAATAADQANAWLNSQGSFAMGNLANEAESLGLTGANAEIGAGGAQQQFAQQELNIPYQQFQAAQAFPYQMTNYLEGMATGTGALSGTRGSTTQPGPSPFSQVAGLGLAGLGIAGGLGWAPFAKSGGRIDNDKLRAIRSLRRDIVPHRDVGGAVGPMMNPAAPMAGMGAPMGSPMASNLYSQYAQLPTEKLQELAVRMPGNPMLQRALQMRRMQPQADPTQQSGLGMQPQTQQMQSSPGGYAEGGELRRPDGGLIPEDSMGEMSLPMLYGAPGQSQPEEYGPPASAAVSPWMQRINSAITSDTPWGEVTNQPVGQKTADWWRGHGAAAPSGPPRAGLSMEPVTAQNTSSWQDEEPRLPQYGGFQAPPIPQASTGVPQPPPRHQQPQHAMHAATPPPMAGLGPPQQGAPSPPADQGYVDQGTWDQPSSGGGEGQHTPPHHSNFMATPSGMLLAAGLGILGGRSPFASVNIGEGGLKGLELGEHAQERQIQQDYNNIYRQQVLGLRGQGLGIQQQRADQGEQNANTRALSQQAREKYQGIMADVANRRLTMQQGQNLFNDYLKQQGFQFNVAKAGVASGQRERALDQGDTRIANAQANAQAAQAIRRQQLQQTQDAGEKRLIQTATNAQIHAAASLAGSQGIPYAKALQQIQGGGGQPQAAPMPAAAPAAATGQQKPSLQSIFGQ